MAKTYPRIVELLRLEFDEKKITKYAFCKKTGINPTSVDRYLCGISEPSKDTLEKLAEYFHVSVWYLLGSNAKEAYDTAGKPSPDDPYFMGMWDNMSMETVLELESGIRKYPELWELFFSIPRENKEEAFKMLKIYMEGLSIAGLRIFRERNKLDTSLEWHDQIQGV